MVISELCEYKGDTFKLVLDGEQTFFINALIADEFNLKKGMRLTGEQLERIKSADTLRKAKKRALYLLGEREMCRGELLAKLTRTYGGEVAEAAADYIESLGYIDDEKYAGKLAEYLIRRKHFGIRRARLEMRRRGLDGELVNTALDAIPQEKVDSELAALIERRYSTKLRDKDDRRRTVAALCRRGYDISSIKQCVAEYLDNSESEDFEDE